MSSPFDARNSPERESFGTCGWTDGTVGRRRFDEGLGRDSGEGAEEERGRCGREVREMSWMLIGIGIGTGIAS